MPKHRIHLSAFVLFLCLLVGFNFTILTGEASAQTNAGQVSVISAITTPQTYYVSANSGNDNNNGVSTSSAFKTIQAAANLTNPGDTVLIMNGTYTNSSTNNGQVAEITRSGTANAWITYKAYPGNSPKIQQNTAIGAWNGILVHNGASYIQINGLEIAGNNSNLTLSYAQSQSQNTGNPLTSGNCITVDGRQNGHPHHISIVNNKVHDCGGAGIATIQADYITITGNQVFNNAWYTVYGTSGISTWQNWNFDNSTGYRMIIENNTVYNNREYIPWIYAGAITDGNGIIVDDSRNTQNGSTLGAYTGRTLVANNLVYKNGGGGVVVYSSDHVDVVNNTTYYNNQSPELKKAQIDVSSASDINAINNILIPISGKNINSIWDVSNVSFDYNLYGNGTSANTAIQGSHDFFGDSKFVNSSSPDFRLLSSSGAIDKGYVWSGLNSDFAGNSRPSGHGYDIGAYEYQLP